MSGVHDEALDWLVRLAADNDADTHAEFNVWKNTSPAHADAFAKAQHLWDSLGQAEALDAALEKEGERPQAEASTRTPDRRRWKWRWPALGLASFAAAAVAAVVLIGPIFAPTPNEPLRMANLSDVSNSQILADGSTLVLGPMSEASVAFEDNTRRVELVSGDAFFDIVSDPDQPFIVVAGTAQIQVSGTAFDVRRSAETLRVAVGEGEVLFRNSGLSPITMRAGYGVLLVDGVLERKTVPVDLVRNWQGGRLTYSDVPLSIIAADLSRYNRGLHVSVEPGIADLRMTATIEGDEPDAALEAIALANGLELRRPSEGRVRIVRDAP